MIRNRRSHSLHDVIHRVQPGIDNCFAKGFQSRHIQSDVVIDDKNRSSAMIAGVADVRQYAIEGVRVKIPTTHFDDRTEATVERAASRSLDHIDLLPEQRVPAQDTHFAIGQPYISALKAAYVAFQIMKELSVAPIR